MFVRIQVTVRRAEHLERVYENDLVGEMSASEDGAKMVNQAIDKLAEQEARLK